MHLGICIYFLSEILKDQVIVATLSGGDGVLTYTSDLWVFLHNIVVSVTYHPCQASAPQAC